MKVAIIGSGISGLSAAYLLNKKYDITLFESDHRLGGHTATKDIELEGQKFSVDTGFIVYNDWTYPNFIKLLKQIKVESQPTSMGFSVFSRDQNFEYAGNNLNTLFSQRRLLASPSHLRMISDILRFNKAAEQEWKNGSLDEGQSLGAYLQQNRYSQVFIDRYLIPMGAAIWSSSTGDMLNFPLRFFVQFFHNHGLLNVRQRPTWRVIKGGSKTYIDPLTSSFKSKIKLNSAVTSIKRHGSGVTINCGEQSYEFDHVVLACHSDQALKLLIDPSEDEVRYLAAIQYRKNDVVMHTDDRWLPRLQRTWSSWNYCLSNDKQALPVLTYNMNILQGIKSQSPICVTLNVEEGEAGDEKTAACIDRNKVLGRYQYHHPVFNLAAIEAQLKWSQVCGPNTWYCGAYWFNGFHEDGVNSAIRVAKQLGVDF